MAQWVTQNDRPNCGVEKPLNACRLVVDAKSTTSRVAGIVRNDVDNYHAIDNRMTGH